MTSRREEAVPPGEGLGDRLKLAEGNGKLEEEHAAGFLFSASMVRVRFIKDSRADEAADLAPMRN